MAEPSRTPEIECAVFLKAIGDPLRLQIVRGLQSGPLTVSDIALSLDQEIGVVSHHLRVLFHAHVVTTQRDGKFIYYSLSEDLLNPRTRKQLLDFGCCKLDIGPMTTH